MSPTDPRHGTYAGAQVHKADGEPQCGPCADARYRYTKQMKFRLARTGSNIVPLGDAAYSLLTTYPIRLLGELSGIPDPKLYTYLGAGPEVRVHVDTRASLLGIPSNRLWTAIGIRRRIRALTALGWSAERVADESGLSRSAILTLRKEGDLTFVRRPTALGVLRAYEVLSMSLPSDPSPQSRAAATRCRDLARKYGWPPPLGWNLIDDPNETPTGWQRVHNSPGDRVGAVIELADMGLGLTEIARRLKVSNEAVEKLLERAGRRDVYRRIALREAVSENQHSRGAA